MKVLKPGDPCPLCGRPIQTTDPEELLLLTLLAEFLPKVSDSDPKQKEMSK